MSTVGGYSLHCYCDHPEHVGWRDGYWPGEYVGRNVSEAKQEARTVGWRFFAEPAPADSIAGGRKTYCPLHARKP